EVGVERVLPVRRALHLIRQHQARAIEPQRLQLRAERAEVRVQVHGRVRRGLDEDEAVPLLRRNGDEVLAVVDEAAELRLVRYADRPARGVEGPAVETAGEAAGLAAVLANDPGAAVRADVQEGADLAVLAAQHHDRNADVLEDLIAARLGDIRGETG